MTVNTIPAISKKSKFFLPEKGMHNAACSERIACEAMGKEPGQERGKEIVWQRLRFMRVK